RDVHHLLDHVGDHDLTRAVDPLRGGQTRAAGARGELEDAVIRTKVDSVEHRLRDLRASLVDIVGVGAPRTGDARPPPMDEAARLARVWGGRHDRCLPLAIRYSLRVLNYALGLSSGITEYRPASVQLAAPPTTGGRDAPSDPGGGRAALPARRLPGDDHG